MQLNALTLAQYTLEQCPRCNALKDTPCVNKRGEIITNIHVARVQSLKTPVQTPATQQSETGTQYAWLETGGRHIVEGYSTNTNTIHYDYIDHITEKAVLVVCGTDRFWIPKAIILSHTESTIVVPNGWTSRKAFSLVDGYGS